MAHIYETIIIGATPDGVALAKKLQSKKRAVLLISKSFPKTSVDYTFETLQAEATYITYARGVFGISVNQGSVTGAVYGTKLVLATGTRPVKSSLKNTNICYKASDIVGRHTSEAAIVCGNNELATEAALDLSKRFCKVYLCTAELDLACSNKLKSKLSATVNILHLPRCEIIGCKNNKAGKLSEVISDNYGSFTASVLVCALGRYADIPTFAKRYIKTTPDGFAEVGSTFESTLVPGVYAIGALCRKFSKADLETVAKNLS